VQIKLTAAPDRLPADGKTRAEILAVVTGKNGESIPGAYVEFSTGQSGSRKGLRRRSDRTGADGTAKNQFTMDEDVQGDSVEIVAAVESFDSKKLRPPLQGRCKITVTTNLVEGTVKDQQGNPLESVKVYLKNIKEDWNTREKTGPGGEFRFEDWDPGKYEIRAVKTGYDESEKSTGDFFLERSGKVHIDLELIEQLTLELDIDPETLEAGGKDQSKITVKLQGAEKRPVEGESIQAKVEGENSGQLDRETISTGTQGTALFRYTASETRGEFNIRVWPESRPSLEKVGTIKQEASPYYEVEYADRIIRVYMKEEAGARTRGLTIADLEKVRVLRIDRETPFPGTVAVDRYLVAAVYAVFGYRAGDPFYKEQIERSKQVRDGARELAKRLEKQRYDADWYNAMAKGTAEFKQYVDILVMLVNPPNPLDTAKTILAGGKKAILTAFDLLLGVNSEMLADDARGKPWFSGKEWLSKDLCMEKMREALNQQIEALKKMADAAEELGKSWERTQPGGDAPNLRIRQVLPFDTRSDAYQVLWHTWKYLAAEQRRLCFYTQWERMDSPPQLKMAGETLDLHEEQMEEQKLEAKKIEDMAESMKKMAEQNPVKI
jgi:hypothetical protein